MRNPIDGACTITEIVSPGSTADSNQKLTAKDWKLAPQGDARVLQTASEIRSKKKRSPR
jgi:hypothetical protein